MVDILDPAAGRAREQGGPLRCGTVFACRGLSEDKDSASRAQKQTKFANLPRRRLSGRGLSPQSVQAERTSKRSLRICRGAACLSPSRIGFVRFLFGDSVSRCNPSPAAEEALSSTPSFSCHSSACAGAALPVRLSENVASVSRLGNSSELDCARLDELVPPAGGTGLQDESRIVRSGAGSCPYFRAESAEDRFAGGLRRCGLRLHGTFRPRFPGDPVLGPSSDTRSPGGGRHGSPHGAGYPKRCFVNRHVRFFGLHGRSPTVERTGGGLLSARLFGSLRTASANSFAVRLIWCDLCGQSAKIRLTLPRINWNRN